MLWPSILNDTELVTLLLVAVVVGSGYSQFCTKPTEESLKLDLEGTVILSSSKQEMLLRAPTVDVSRLRIVCLTFSEQQDLLRDLSVVVQYNEQTGTRSRSE